MYDMVCSHYKTHFAISRGLQKPLQVCALMCIYRVKLLEEVHLLLKHCFVCTNVANANSLSGLIRCNSLWYMLVQASLQHVISTINAACPSFSCF
jgi:citrate lyase alpha subunit